MTTSEENIQDDLEKKIDEAEMEAQFEESVVESDSVSSFDGEAAESDQVIEEGKKKPGKGQLIFRRILIWLVVIAIAFAGGFFLDALIRYQPEKAKVEELVGDLNAAAVEISTLEGEIERLSVFEDQNISLNEEIADLTTHLTILSARAAVADATLALEQDRVAEAKLSLDKVGTTLETLKTMLNEDQSEVVDNMLQRHQLIQIELTGDVHSAQTDLEVLASKLSGLENTLFSAP
jgi:hypothetical protein